jgi:hypothetical protein
VSISKETSILSEIFLENVAIIPRSRNPDASLEKTIPAKKNKAHDR